MVKRSIIQRQIKRQKIVDKYALKKKLLANSLKLTNNLKEKYDLYLKIQQMPRNSSKTRLRNRCWKTGKARGYFRFFGLCRNFLRKFANECILSGITKSSW